jgi:hypothetical protein
MGAGNQASSLSEDGVLGAGTAYLLDRDVLLWSAALVLYGVGDTVTTLWGLSTPGVAEGGPVAGPLIEAYGGIALVGIKIALFAGFVAVWHRLRTPGRVAVPLALICVGAIVTGWNLAVILGL